MSTTATGATEFDALLDTCIEGVVQMYEAIAPMSVLQEMRDYIFATLEHTDMHRDAIALLCTDQVLVSRLQQYACAVIDDVDYELYRNSSRESSSGEDSGGEGGGGQKSDSD